MSSNTKNIEKINVLIIVLIVAMLYLFYKQRMVKIYRFFKAGCGYCTSSKDEWNKFKSLVRFELVNPIDVDNDNTSDKHAEFVNNFGVKAVPTIWKVHSDGRRYEYNGDRSAEDLYKFAHQ